MLTMGKKSKAATAAATKESKTAEQPVEQVTEIEQPVEQVAAIEQPVEQVAAIEQPASGEQPDGGDQLGDEESDDESADVAPTKSVRFLVSISGHDFNAVPGQVIELSDEQAIAFADGERAELVDAPAED